MIGLISLSSFKSISKNTLSKKYNKPSIWTAYLHNFRKRKLKVFSFLLN